MIEVPEHFRVEVAPTGQLRLVQRLEHTGLEQRRHQRGVEHHQVVAGAAGQQLALHGFVGVEGVVDHLDAGGLLEAGDGVLADVVGPVVEVKGVVVGAEAHGRQGRQGRAEYCRKSGPHVSPACCCCRDSLSADGGLGGIPRKGGVPGCSS
ncbi:hypothetical protein D9M71_563550 [compost metagenome]